MGVFIALKDRFFHNISFSLGPALATCDGLKMSPPNFTLVHFVFSGRLWPLDNSRISENLYEVHYCLNVQ